MDEIQLKNLIEAMCFDPSIPCDIANCKVNSLAALQGNGNDKTETFYNQVVVWMCTNRGQHQIEPIRAAFATVFLMTQYDFPRALVDLAVNDIIKHKSGFAEYLALFSIAAYLQDARSTIAEVTYVPDHDAVHPDQIKPLFESIFFKNNVECLKHAFFALFGNDFSYQLRLKTNYEGITLAVPRSHKLSGFFLAIAPIINATDSPRLIRFVILIMALAKHHMPSATYKGTDIDLGRLRAKSAMALHECNPKFSQDSIGNINFEKLTSRIAFIAEKFESQ